MPMTFSILIQEASISLANSLTAWFGSSYVKGSTYILTPAERHLQEEKEGRKLKKKGKEEGKNEG